MHENIISILHSLVARRSTNGCYTTVIMFKGGSVN